MKVTYTRVNSLSMRGKIIEARYKNVIMELEEGDDLVFIYGMESSNQGKGECQEMIDLITTVPFSIGDGSQSAFTHLLM